MHVWEYDCFFQFCAQASWICFFLEYCKLHFGEDISGNGKGNIFCKYVLKETILTAVSPKNVYINLNLGWNKTKLKKNLDKQIKNIRVMSCIKWLQWLCMMCFYSRSTRSRTKNINNHKSGRFEREVYVSEVDTGRK
jgi:hypothetical protein